MCNESYSNQIAKIHRGIERNTDRRNRVGDIFIIEGLRLHVRGESACTYEEWRWRMPQRRSSMYDYWDIVNKKEDYYANATSVFHTAFTVPFHAVSQLCLTQRFAQGAPESTESWTRKHSSLVKFPVDLCQRKYIRC